MNARASYKQASSSGSADIPTGSENGFLTQLSTTNGDFPVGTTNWTLASQVPDGSHFRIICIPSGSSGGSGGLSTLVLARPGGSGAGGSARAERWVSRAEVIAALPIAIVVPAGTAGATGVIASLIAATGTDGNPGSVCSFGSLLSAYSGTVGFGTGTSSNGASIGGSFRFVGGGSTNNEGHGGQSGSSNATVAGLPGQSNTLGGGGGGGGGGHTTAGAGLDGGAGGASGYRTDGSVTGNGGIAGLTAGAGALTNGGDGAPATVRGRVGAAGGGGSGNGTTGGTGGKGGNGGIPGGAGGGGGAAETDGVTPATSGAGGDGARGEVVFEAYA